METKDSRTQDSGEEDEEPVKETEKEGPVSKKERRRNETV